MVEEEEINISNLTQTFTCHLATNPLTLARQRGESAWNWEVLMSDPLKQKSIARNSFFYQEKDKKKILLR